MSCYVGKRNLEKAIQSFKDVDFEVNWKPFFLNPNTPDEGVPLLDYLSKKYGPAAAQGALSHTGPLSQAGAELGITFNPQRMITNTLKSHCLVDYAQTVGKQDAVIETLFKRYFEQGDNINNIDILQDIATQTSLDFSSAAKHMENPDIISKIKQEVDGAYQQGVHGVPYFVLSLKGEGSPSQPGFSGAQPPATFRSIINRLLMHAKV